MLSVKDELECSFICSSYLFYVSGIDAFVQQKWWMVMDSDQTTKSLCLTALCKAFSTFSDIHKQTEQAVAALERTSKI